jgi:hypothetical protein
VTDAADRAESRQLPETPVFEYRKPRRPFRAMGPRGFAPGGVGGCGGGAGGRRLVWLQGVSGGYTILLRKSNGGAPALLGRWTRPSSRVRVTAASNVLVLGIGGQGHEAPNLSDTILVMSIDPKTKDAAMLSIPRDLYVKMPAVAKYQHAVRQD